MSEMIVRQAAGAPPLDDDRPPDPTNFGMYYARLLHQQNMLQDMVRTTMYRRAIESNRADFDGKVVLDVGSGSGILAFFAARAGAGRVYAVEASAMAEKAAKLIGSLANVKLARYSPLAAGAQDSSAPALRTADLSADDAWAALDPSFRIHVLRGKVEDVTIPERVDVIVSEPLGFVLVHERMLEAFITARERFLKPGGRMMPSHSTIYVAPISDANLWEEQRAKASFWATKDFFGVDLSPLHDDALDEYFGQAIVGYFSPEAIIAREPFASKCFDFGTVSLGDLRDFEVPLDFVICRTSLLHGFGCWFDTAFDGSSERVVLSTAPASPGTHWYQCRVLLRSPVAVNASQRVTGNLRFRVNDRLSYDIAVEVRLDGTDITSTQNIHLDDQIYHYLHHP